MPVFRYKAINTEGVTAEGTLTAPGRREALDMLRQRQSHPVSLEEEKNRNVNLKRNQSVKAKDLSVFLPAVLLHAQRRREHPQLFGHIKDAVRKQDLARGHQ